MSYYDAIFKDLINNPNSRILQTLTGRSRGKPYPTDAGWYTGRSVDYLSKIGDQEFVHVEVQTGKNATMHWRMLNYYTLLQHKLEKWKRNDVAIHQYVIYIGPGTFGMDGGHHIVRDEFAFEVINLSSMQVPSVLNKSPFYADHIVSLLMADQGRQDWIRIFKAICNMRRDEHMLDALFVLQTLAGLRNMETLIETEIRKASLTDALKSSPLTQRAHQRAAKSEAIAAISRTLVRRGLDGLDIDEVETLEHESVSLDEVRLILDEIIEGASFKTAMKQKDLSMGG